MKKIDYYAQHEPWKMPKWVGITIGTIFASVAVGALVVIVHLTRPAHADVPPKVATAEVAAPAAPAPVVTAAPVQPAPTAAVPGAHAKHAKSHASHKETQVASLGTQQHRAAIVARHETASKRKQKDDLDRLLGL